MNTLPSRALPVAGTYFGIVLLLVAAANLGLVPGAGIRPPEGAAGPHVYQFVMVGAVAVLALVLGPLCAWIGRALGAWHLGLHYPSLWS